MRPMPALRIKITDLLTAPAMAVPRPAIPTGLGVSARWLDCGLDRAHGTWSTWYGHARAAANAPDIEE